MFGVAALGLLEDAGDHDRRVGDNAGTQPLVGSDPPRGGLMSLGRCGGEDVGDRAARWLGVVDRADLRHPLAIALLFPGQAGLRLGSRTRGAGGGAGSERVGAHDDPLPVAGEHQQLIWLSPRLPPGFVEVFEIDRGKRGEFLDLAFAQPHARAALDRVDRVLEAAASGLQRGELAEPVRVALDRQIQRRVGGMQVPHPAR
jgi:hypothetical protein